MIFKFVLYTVLSFFSDSDFIDWLNYKDACLKLQVLVSNYLNTYLTIKICVFFFK